MTDTISITGTIATDPVHSVAGTGKPMTRFRVVSQHRQRDDETGTWSDASTNWYTVRLFGAIARNAATSLRKGERVVVRGRLQVREWADGERKGTEVEVLADSIGHDLLWGTSAFTRAPATGGDARAATSPAVAPAAEGWAVPGADDAPAALELAETPF